MKNSVNFKMTVSKITTIKVGSVLSGQIEAGKIEVGDEIIFEIQNEKNKLEVIGISDNDKKKRVNKAEKNQDVGLLVKEKQCEKIGLQEGMIIYIPQETSEEEFFSELFGDMDQTENVTEKSVELQEKSIPQNENAIRVVIVYSDKLESISVDGTYMEDIFSIQNIPIPNWFDVKQDRNGWRGLIEEIREVIDDYDVDLIYSVPVRFCFRLDISHIPKLYLPLCLLRYSMNNYEYSLILTFSFSESKYNRPYSFFC